MNTFRNIRKGLMLVDTSSDPNFFRSQIGRAHV